MSVITNPAIAFSSFPGSDLLVAQSGVVSSVTGTTDETELFSVYIPTYLIGPNSRIEIRPAWRFPNSANNKIVSVKCGTDLGSAGTVYTRTRTTATGEQPLVVLQCSGNVANQLRPYEPTGTYSTNSTTSGNTSTFDFSTGLTLYITGKLADISETIYLDACSIKIIGPNKT